MFRKLTAILLLLLFSAIISNAQVLQWAKNVGGNDVDYSNRSVVDKAGNLYVTGSFQGVNVDFDPGPGSFLLSSAGVNDGFVAKYDANGKFIWAFSIGGNNRDEVNDVALDKAGNFVITGFFRGNGVDFDPGSGTALLNSNGDSGGDPGFGGDMFVAKYDTSGKYKWAFNMGSFEMYDNGTAIITDSNNDILVAGYFQNTVDFDPSAGVANLSFDNGSIFLAKYSADGQYKWALNAGPAGKVDNSATDVAVDGLNNVVITGFYQGSDIDFDPSPAVHTLSSNGSLEIFVAKYDASGQYVWANTAGGAGADVGRSLTIDKNNDIYVTGDYNSSSFSFNRGFPGGVLNNGGNDLFVVKYSSGGGYLWAFGTGGSENEFSFAISLDDDGNVLISGAFTGTNVDFDPSTGISSLSSKGGNDLYAAKYSPAGAYICSFSIGGPGDDLATSIANSGKYSYLVGRFDGSNVDFDPSATTVPLTSASTDAFVAKYDWTTMPPAGTISGKFDCTTRTSQITFAATAGAGPFILYINDGTGSTTYNNIQSGTPFTLSSPTSAITTYTLTGIKDAGICTGIAPANSSATIATSIVSLVTSGDKTICAKDSAQLSASGGITYQWFPVTGLNNPNAANPKASPNASTTYKVIASAPNACSDSATVTIVVHPLPTVTLTADTAICAGDSLQLFAAGGTSYRWTPATGLNNAGISTPKASPTAATLYKLVVGNQEGCTNSSTVTIGVKPKPVAAVSPLAAQLCLGDSLRLNATGGISYRWSPSTDFSDATAANPIVFAQTTTSYNVVVANAESCKDSANTLITVVPKPKPDLGKDTSICRQEIIRLDASVSSAVDYVWSTGETTSSIDIQQAGTFSVMVNLSGCKSPSTDTIVVRGLGSPTVSLGKDTTICSATPLILTARGTDIERYLWSNGSTDSTLIADRSGLYQVSVSNKCDTANAAVVITVDNCSDDLFFPSAFTPNSNGRNEQFKALSLYPLQIASYELQVFNRWGQRLFYTKDASKGWDGRVNGQQQESAVYVWMARYRLSANGPVQTRKGTVILIR